MSSFLNLLSTSSETSSLSAAEATDLARMLGDLSGLTIYPSSVIFTDGAVFFMGRQGLQKVLGILSREGRPAFSGDRQPVVLDGESFVLQRCATDPANAQALRQTLPFTAPTVLGLKKAAGCGDRLGLATPGHVRAVRKHTLAPVFAQQSIREMVRTARTPQQVLDDATWGVFQEGWRQGYGADADHLKTTADIDNCVAAGYTFYTVDPGEYVDNEADTADAALIIQKLEMLPWQVLDASPAHLRDLYLGRSFDLGHFSLTFDEGALLRAAVKYGRAVAHTTIMYRHLAAQMGERPFELEMSVDETESPTSVLEHFFVASELKRLAVRWVSLAPRYVGRFEKGVDYIGDLDVFAESFAKHVAIARSIGPYKLSLHSGSDKFRLYPVFAAHAGNLVHLKTAGTSYLEALRVIARVDPPLFREILAFARERFDVDRATYYISAQLAKVPLPDQLKDEALETLLDQFDARQVLHVTFGSVLTARDAAGHFRFRDRLLEDLQTHEEMYYQVLEKHFDRHLAPFD